MEIIFENNLIAAFTGSDGDDPYDTHAIIIPDNWFELYEPEDIVSLFRKFCYLRTRRKLILPSNREMPWNQTFRRQDVAALLKWLATVRFYTYLDERQHNKAGNQMRRKMEPGSTRDDRMAAKKAHACMIERSRCDSDFRSCGSAYREIFNVSDADGPISVPCKFLKPGVARTRKRKVKVLSGSSPAL